MPFRHPLSPENEEVGPCEKCGQDIDDCECTHCKYCGVIGDPVCDTQEHIDTHISWD